MNTCDQEKSVALLLEAGADPNLLNGIGENALDIAEMMGESRAGVAALLRKAGGKLSKGEGKSEL
jgi:ankyrin repeat protein